MFTGGWHTCHPQTDGVWLIITGKEGWDEKCTFYVFFIC